MNEGSQDRDDTQDHLVDVQAELAANPINDLDSNEKRLPPSENYLTDASVERTGVISSESSAPTKALADMMEALDARAAEQTRLLRLARRMRTAADGHAWEMAAVARVDRSEPAAQQETLPELPVSDGLAQLQVERILESIAIGQLPQLFRLIGETTSKMEATGTISRDRMVDVLIPALRQFPEVVTASDQINSVVGELLGFMLKSGRTLDAATIQTCAQLDLTLVASRFAEPRLAITLSVLRGLNALPRAEALAEVQGAPTSLSALLGNMVSNVAERYQATGRSHDTGELARFRAVAGAFHASELSADQAGAALSACDYPNPSELDPASLAAVIDDVGYSIGAVSRDDADSAYVATVAAAIGFAAGNPRNVTSRLFNAGTTLARMEHDDSSKAILLSIRSTLYALGYLAGLMDWQSEGKPRAGTQVATMSSAVNLVATFTESLVEGTITIDPSMERVLGALRPLSNVPGEDGLRLTAAYRRLEPYVKLDAGPPGQLSLPRVIDAIATWLENDPEMNDALPDTEDVFRALPSMIAHVARRIQTSLLDADVSAKLAEVTTSPDGWWGFDGEMMQALVFVQRTASQREQDPAMTLDGLADVKTVDDLPGVRERLFDADAIEEALPKQRMSGDGLSFACEYFASVAETLASPHT